MRRFGLRVAFLLGAVLLVAKTGSAQVAIAGVVKDGTGAVMPGVTVEAASPALIEKMRSVVSDAAGQYKIIDLSPGTYEVTFTLPGFKLYKRAGIVLEGNFTAQVNAELQVGAVEETITITAETPTVDTIGTQKSFVINREALDVIPTSRRDTTSRAALIPGTTVTPFVLGQYNLTTHGSSTSDFTMAIDGLRVNNLCGSGQYSGFYMNDGAIQELSYLTGSESAEVQSSGIRVNQVPKDGGNKFSGSIFLYGQGSGLQSDNRTDDMKKIQANGLPLITIAGTAYDWQINPSVGGPIVKDKAWFFFTYKYQDNKIYVPSARFPDGSQAYRNSMGNYSGIGRVTWQATSKDKIRAYVEKQFTGEFYNGFNTYANMLPEASSDAWGRGWIPQVRWTRAHSNKLLLEAGLAYYDQPYEQNCSRDNTSATALPKLNADTGLLSGRCGYLLPAYASTTKDYNVLANASYVTGSHAMKFGLTDLWGENSRTFAPRADINTLIVLTRTIPGLGPVVDFPAQVAVYNSPATSIQNVNSDFGMFAQDAWTMKRLTLNYGLRFDHFNASVPAESSPASTWIAARNFEAVPNVPNWNDWALRFAAAYDLTGDGKTAIKGNVGKYVAAQAAGLAQTFNSMSGSTQTRTWSDSKPPIGIGNGDGTILNANGTIQTNEVLGGTPNFGQVTTKLDPALARGYNWEYSAVIQREIRPRVSATAGYYHRDFYNLQVTDNTNVAATDWNSYTINTPTDSRLPLSGQPIVMYSLNPGLVGVETKNLVTYSTSNKTTYNGVEFTVNARGSKYLLFGGMTTDKRASTSCDERDNANGLRFCDSVPPFRTTFKASGAYNFPYDVQLSGSFSSIPGGGLSANYTVTSAIANRTIIGSTAGAATTVVNLIEPGTVFLDTLNRLDLRLGKMFRFSDRRLQAYMDIFNIFNAGTVTSVNTTYAASGTNLWMTPQTIVEGRYVRFGMQLNF
ncbi:MAG TPA: TonB-dependent receptor [Vicinamibacterales bacterium]|nr:TonB-dependent receptor [Vicinamibacterales bacterium]